MMGIGLPELIVIGIILGWVVVCFWLPLHLRKRYPNRMWLGILLSIVIVPWGQLYLERSVGYIIAICACFGIVKVLYGTGVAGIATVTLSVLMMQYRLRKQRPSPLTRDMKVERLRAAQEAAQRNVEEFGHPDAVDVYWEDKYKES